MAEVEALPSVAKSDAFEPDQTWNRFHGSCDRLARVVDFVDQDRVSQNTLGTAMQQIVDGLNILGVFAHALCIAQRRIDVSVLPDLADQALEKLPTVLGDRRKIFCAIAAPFMLMAIAGAAVAGPLEDGYSALNDGKYANALQLFRPLADEGNVGARKAIAIINDYCLNADKGNGLAQFTLGFIYERGLGLPQDDVRAYMWFSLAAAQGTKGAEEWRERLAAHMSPAQIAEAQRLAREWKLR